MITDAPLFRILRREVSRPGGQKAAANRLGVSQSHLCDVLHRRREFSAKILSGLGFRRVVMYERVVKPARSSGGSV